jgi:hypothetical protein
METENKSSSSIDDVATPIYMRANNTSAPYLFEGENVSISNCIFMAKKNGESIGATFLHDDGGWRFHFNTLDGTRRYVNGATLDGWAVVPSEVYREMERKMYFERIKKWLASTIRNARMFLTGKKTVIIAARPPLQPFFSATEAE